MIITGAIIRSIDGIQGNAAVTRPLMAYATDRIVVLHVS
jgi:hypothetical protein